MRKRILIVGAGMAGSVLARELADTGDYVIDIIDKRIHIAGNCADIDDPVTGVRYHLYGPHLFHTSDQGVVDFLSRFTGWIPYEHKVQAYVEGVGHVPMPINRLTVQKVSGLDLPDTASLRAYLSKTAIPRANPANAREMAESKFGVDLTELFFARYSKKMWDLDLGELPAETLARLPIRLDDSDGYFKDSFQALPKDGYTSMFRSMLDHPAIRISLLTEFNKTMEAEYDHVFNSMPIDVYFEEMFGPLRYRSIKFQTFRPKENTQPVPTVNFTDTGEVTRRTDWRLYPGHGGRNAKPLITDEIPCDYRDNNMERYYPVRTVDNDPQKVYKLYADMAKTLGRVTFIGRCGQYRYFDMHQVVANSRMIAKRFIS